MSAETGKKLTGIPHLRQSIHQILTTPIGSRVMNRAFGSRLYSLIDSPINAATQAQIYAAVADAIDKWEPRYQLQSVELHKFGEGQLTMNLVGKYVATGETTLINNLEI